jgi:serpin B
MLRLGMERIQGAGRKVGPFVLIAGMCHAVFLPACDARNSAALQLSNNFAFSVDALRFYCDQPGNWVFSPHGPLELGAAVAFGARGKTQEELRTAFHLGSDIPSRTSIAADSIACEIGTSMWISPKAHIFPDYKKTIQEQFDAELGKGYSAQLINDWVAKRTRGHITRLIEQELDPLSRMILVNAVYFRGVWPTPFDEKLTKPLPFHVDAQTTLDVPTMARTGKFRYQESETSQMIIMDYEGGDFVYVCLLPREGNTPSDLVRNWSEGTLAELLQSGDRTRVEVYLPRFKMRWRESLKPLLRKGGVSLAFDPRAADFSGIADKQLEPLHIHEFLQECTFDLDEKGTVATAATYVEMHTLSEEIIPDVIPVFRADRPFLFLVVAPRARCVLFAGVVANPAAAES